MLSAVIRGFSRHSFRPPVRRHGASAFIDELLVAGKATPHTNEKFNVRQLPVKPTAEEVLHRFYSIRRSVRKPEFLATLPPAEWWTEFRRRLTATHFQPDRTNWQLIVRSVTQLNALRIKLGQKDSSPATMAFLPPAWYPLLLDLAYNCDIAKRDILPSIKDLYWLFSMHRVQFGDERQRKAAALFERYCTRVDDCVDALLSVLRLGYPVSRTVWQRVADSQLDVYSPATLAKLLNHAASYWALWLPGKPPAVLLHRLIMVHPFWTSHRRWNLTSRWYLRYLQLGEEFIPQDILKQVNAGVKMMRPLSFKESRRVQRNPRLEKELLQEHGAVKIESNIVPPNTVEMVDYLLTKADGSQKVLRDARAMDSFYSFYWQVPEDVRGQQTVTLRMELYLIKRAGYEFGWLNKRKTDPED